METMRACADRRAQDLSVRHARHDDVARELRLAAELLGRVPARDRAADGTAGRCCDDVAHAAASAWGNPWFPHETPSFAVAGGQSRSCASARARRGWSASARRA